MTDRFSRLISNRIKLLCDRRGISIYQLCQMSGVSHSTMNHIINGRTTNPGLKTMHKIATAFSMTLSEFLDFKELNAFSFEDDPID